MMWKLTALLWVLGMASAQDTLTFTPDMLSGFASNPVFLGLFVFGVIATIKRDVERRQPPVLWNPWLWRSIAALLGLLSSVLLHIWTGRALLFTTDWTDVLAFGLLAAIIAVIGRDGLKTALGWLGFGSPVVGSADTVNVTPGDKAAPAGEIVEVPTGFQPLAQLPQETVQLQDGPDYPAATRTDWPALISDEAPLAEQRRE